MRAHPGRATRERPGDPGRYPDRGRGRPRHTPGRCSQRSLSVVLPTVQATTAEAVAYMSILNRGPTCQLAATASLTVVTHGARVASIRANPVSYRIDQP